MQCRRHSRLSQCCRPAAMQCCRHAMLSPCNAVAMQRQGTLACICSGTHELHHACIHTRTHPHCTIMHASLSCMHAAVHTWAPHSAQSLKNAIKKKATAARVGHSAIAALPRAWHLFNVQLVARLGWIVEVACCGLGSRTTCHFSVRLSLSQQRRSNQSARYSHRRPHHAAPRAQPP